MCSLYRIVIEAISPKHDGLQGSAFQTRDIAIVRREGSQTIIVFCPFPARLIEFRLQEFVDTLNSALARVANAQDEIPALAASSHYQLFLCILSPMQTADGF
ncbi:hypothetical protein niasHT_022470 [Heterodera trifolii]|uniref:Uncharacterized protein n=1 Tax=Heterodera trifolii TaxID=157864 RepID=A0ABD2JGT8_9BILA